MKKAMTRRFAGVLALSMTLTTAAFADPVSSFPNAELTLRAGWRSLDCGAGQGR